MPVFDAYVVVDWSASSRPKKGKDSIWVADAKRVGGALHLRIMNPSTRSAAEQLLVSLLNEKVSAGRRTLVGMDFPYGYPAGFAAAAGHASEETPPWRSTWERLRREIVDNDSNRNNRFTVAGGLNICCGFGEGPFWGCPKSATYPNVCVNSPRQLTTALKRYRHAEQLLRNKHLQVQEVWKLWTTGSVGSQALVGIPRVSSLRYASDLESHSVVWPFETGFTLEGVKHRRPLIVHSEIWPGVVKLAATDSRVRDEAQVDTLARHFATLDEIDVLEGFFDRSNELVTEKVQECLAEEGWILGA